MSDVIDADFVKGTDEAHAKVLKFLEEKLGKGADFEATVHLQLTQHGRNTTSVVNEWPYGPDDDPEVMATTVTDAAASDAESIGSGACKYLVTIRERPGRVVLKLEVPEDSNELDETPNEKGFLAQTMKHTQTFMNGFQTFATDAYRVLRQENTELRMRIRELEQQDLKTRQIYSELLDNTHLKNLEVHRLQKAEERKDEFSGIAMQLLPAAANKLLGQKAVTEPITPVEAQLHGFLSTLTPDQLSQLGSEGPMHFSAGQKMGFLHLIQSYIDKNGDGAPPNGASPHAGTSPAPPAPSPDPSV